MWNRDRSTFGLRRVEHTPILLLLYSEFSPQGGKQRFEGLRFFHFSLSRAVSTAFSTFRSGMPPYNFIRQQRFESRCSFAVAFRARR